MRINGGKQLTLYGDKATLPVDLTVSTLNGINPSTISLNTHNHDDKYALVDHTHTTNDITDIDTLAKADHNHDTVYASLTHTHTYGSLTGIPETFTPAEHNHDDKYASKEHTHSFNDLENKPELALANHTHTEFNNDVAFKTNVSIYDKLNNICVPSSEHECFLGDPYFPFVDSRGDCWIGDSLTFYLDGGQDKSLGFYSNSESSLSIYNNNNKKLIGFGEDKNRPGTQAVDTYLEFNRSDSTTSYEWRIYSLSNHNLDFVNYQGTRAGYINCISNAQMNITITHNAPLTEDLDKYKIGAPVFMSGKVYKLIDGKYVDRTDTTDCIPSVKAEGKYKEYLGIIVAKHKAGETVTVGDVVKQDVIIDQDTIDFATHGDFYLEVNDASSYKVGDTILYNGDIVNDEEPMTNKIQRMIAGVITAIVGASTLAIFKT